MTAEKKDRGKSVIRQEADELDALKYEVAEDLNLDDNIAEEGWENLTTRQVGKIGGHMVQRMIRFAKNGMKGKRR